MGGGSGGGTATVAAAASHAKQQPKPFKTLWLATKLRCCFYGWVVLAAATVGKIMSGPGQSPVVGQLQPMIRESLGLTRTEISMLYLIATTTSSIVLPFAGKGCDVLGPTVMIGLVSGGLGLACLFQAYLVTNSVTLGISFFLLRFLGQGSMVLVSQYTINQWWVERRGVAMGIGGGLMSVGMVGVLPPVVRVWATTYGWQHTYVILACICLFFMLPLGVLIFRDKPEAYGMLPDGKPGRPQPEAAEDGGSDGDRGDEGTAAAAALSDDPGADAGDVELVVRASADAERAAADDGADAEDGPDATVASVDLEPAWTLREALRTPAFWLFNIAFLQIGATGTAIWFFLGSVAEEEHVSETALNIVFPVTSVTSASMNLIGGILARKYEARYLLMVSLLLHAVALFMMGNLSDTMAVAMAVVNGASFGLFGNLAGIAMAELFGRKHLGAISGASKSFLVLGSALGPLPFGIVKDLTGDFRSAFMWSSVLPIALAVAVVVFGAPPKHKPGGSAAYGRLET